MRVFIDTNGWLRSAAWRIDLFREAQRIVPGKAEFFVVQGTKHELEGLQAAGGTLAREAKLALLIMKDVKVIKALGATADEQLLNEAKDPDFVLTQDQDLKRRLKDKGIGVIVIRNQNHLELENR